jgi:hypothetical protein
MTFVCRAGVAAHGGFVINLVVQALSDFQVRPGRSSIRPPAVLTWCGSRCLIGFSPASSSYSTMLRLPAQVSEGDEFPISVQWGEALSVSASLYDAEGVSADGFEWETIEGAPQSKCVCADPAVAVERAWRDSIAIGVAAAAQRPPIISWAVEALRTMIGGANLGFRIRRTEGSVMAEPLQVSIGVRGMRRLAIIPAGALETSVEFPLAAESAGFRWNLSIGCPEAVEWSASIYRGYDAVFLPAFSAAPA